MITVSSYRCYHTVLSFISRAWQPGLTTLLPGLTYLLSLTSPVEGFEVDMLLYMLELQPAGWGPVTIESIQSAPQWYLIPVYGVILIIFNHRSIRSSTTAAYILAVLLVLVSLLVLEILLTILLQLFLPLVFPALVMLILSFLFWLARLSQGFANHVHSPQVVITSTEVQACIDSGDLSTAVTLLKSCPYDDELLEVGHELGLLLESGKHWSSALDLYRWLSIYEPGLTDHVNRIEGIRNNQSRQSRPKKSASETQPEHLEIGNYRLLKRIARGATAVIYEAIDARSQNRVALKVMRVRPNEKVDRERVRHWLNEAEIVSQLDHDNIVKIHDAGMLGDSAYIAMDYVQGCSMSSRLRKREYLTVGECIRISKAMLRALIVAHDHGVIHGDIKPANIMYDSINDTYILTDFGAAYSNRRDRLNESMIVGTPAYMSPEQLESKKLDGRSDLFSLAVTLYHLLTGYQPFTGNNLPELKHNIVTDEPDLNHLSLPAGITEVLIKALQKKPYMRFADARQMLTSVEYCEKQLRDRMRQQS